MRTKLNKSAAIRHAAFILPVFLLLCGTALNAQTIRYVKTDGVTNAANAANATSWAMACNNLQAVVDSSSAGDTVFVAAGTYSANPFFEMRNGVQVFGGFPAAGNPVMADRTLPVAASPGNLTILRGATATFAGSGSFSTLTTWDGFVVHVYTMHDVGVYLLPNSELRNCLIRKGA